MPLNSEIEVVAAALIDSHKRVLLGQRPFKKSMGGFWELPGGKVEHGETTVQALVRELQEELGIKVKGNDLIFLKDLYHNYNDFQLKMTVFVLHKWQNKIQNKEHPALVWVSIDEMNSYPLPAADVEISSLLKTYLDSKKWAGLVT